MRMFLSPLGPNAVSCSMMAWVMSWSSKMLSSVSLSAESISYSSLQWPVLSWVSVNWLNPSSITLSFHYHIIKEEKLFGKIDVLLTLWYSSCMTELKSCSQVLQSQCRYLTMWASRWTGVGKLRSQTLQVTSSSSGNRGDLTRVVLFTSHQFKSVCGRGPLLWAQVSGPPLIYLFKYKGERRVSLGNLKRNVPYYFLIADGTVWAKHSIFTFSKDAMLAGQS